MISTKELLAQTGATGRQIDWWIDNGYISCEPRRNATSGVGRYFNEETVEIVSVLVRISHAINGRKGSLYKAIAECYQDGFVDLGGGVSITWD